jgi:hypothetical protein
MYTIDDAINDLNHAKDSSVSSNFLPDDRLIKYYEQATGFKFSNDYKKLLKNTGNAFVGFLSLLVLNPKGEEHYGELQNAIREGREIGLPESWLPICEDNSDYYCLTPNGEIRFWSHDGDVDEKWADLATWVKEVWLEGN